MGVVEKALTDAYASFDLHAPVEGDAQQLLAQDVFHPVTLEPDPPGFFRPATAVPCSQPGLENFGLLGYTLGGFIAQVIVCEHPPLAKEFYSSAPLRGG